MNGKRKFQVIVISVMVAVAAFCPQPSQAQTNAPPNTNNPPTIQSGIDQLIAAFKNGQSNWYVIPYGLYAPGLQKHAGGGLAAMYPLSDYVVTGLRLDYVNGNFWMPSGNATLQVPLKLTSWLTVTPFTYAGIGIPVSGATVAGATLPGHIPRDNNGQATAILGAGLALNVYNGTGFIRKADIIGDIEQWSGFPGKQYRVGLSLKF